MLRLLSIRKSSLLAVVFCLALSCFAQSQPPSAITSLSEESLISLSSLDLTIESSLPPDLLAAIQAGALEIRQVVTYKSSDYVTQAMQITGYLAAPGSPLPTPLSEVSLPVIWRYTVQVDKAEMVTSPKPGIAFVGTITHSTTPFGDVSGSIVYFAAAYTRNSDSNAPAVTAQFSGVTTNIVGVTTSFSDSGKGSIEIGGLPLNVGPVVAVAGPKGVQTSSATFKLDGTKSSDANGGTLTYQWTLLPVSGQTVSFDDPTSPSPAVTWADNAFAYGDYKFQLTVTNASGQSATDTVVISYVQADPPPVESD